MNVRGLKCEECKEGFFDLQADRSEGCLACDCNTAGKYMQVKLIFDKSSLMQVLWQAVSHATRLLDSAIVRPM